MEPSRPDWIHALEGSFSVRGEGQIHATAELETEIGPGFTNALATAP